MQRLLKQSGGGLRRTGMLVRTALSVALLLVTGVVWADEPTSSDSEVEPPPSGFTIDGGRQKPKDAVPFAGVVREKGSRDPVSGARVTVTPWRELPPDPNAKPGKKAKPRGEVTLDEVREFGGRVHCAPDPVKKEVSEQVLSVEELKRIPGTQNDAIKAVQNLPGVARAPFGGGLLVVWGSAPADTRVYADGVQLPRIFHFAGFRSTINSEFVEELSFKPGAYGADFGRGLGGMIDVTTRSPKSDRIHGSVTLDLIDGSLTLEGPVTKNLYLAGGVRVSWISVFLPIFNRSQFQVSPFYWDYQLSMRYRPTKADDIDVFIFGSTDNLEARVSDPDPAINISLDSRQYFSRARIRWTHRFSSATQLVVMPSIGGDVTRFDTGDGGIGTVQFKLEGLTLGYNLRSELRHRFAPWLNVVGGVDFEGSRSSFEVVVQPIPPGGGGSSGAVPLKQGGLRCRWTPGPRTSSSSRMTRSMSCTRSRGSTFSTSG